MILTRQIAVGKFAHAGIAFEQNQHCLHGGFEALTVKLGLSNALPQTLTGVELFYPSANDGHAARYQAAIDAFWVVVLPGVSRERTRELRDNALHPAARAYEKIFDDVRVTLSEMSGQVELAAYPV